MKLLHTADWHLGQNFYNQDRYREQQEVLRGLVEIIRAEQPDVLLIAGDLYDTANPSAAAQQLFYSFLFEARTVCPVLQTIIIGGNHDSPGRLEAPGPVLGALGVRVVGAVPRKSDGNPDPAGMVVPVEGADGEPLGWVLAVPYLRPDDLPREERKGENGVQNHAAGVAAIYRQTLEHALEARDGRDLPIIAMGHCHLTGGTVSELSERRLVIGGSEALPVSIFADQLAYVALGHLHKPQKVGRENVRYSGSLMPMSFTEASYPHQIVRVETEGCRAARIESIPLPRVAELLRLPGEHRPLDEVLAQLAALDLPQGVEPHRQPWLEVRVLLEEPEPGLRARIEEALAGKAVRLTRIDTRYSRSEAEGGEGFPGETEALETLEPEAVFRALYQRQYDSEPSSELLRAFAEIVEEARHEGEVLPDEAEQGEEKARDREEMEA